MTDVVVIEEDFSPVNWWIFLLQGLIAVIFGVILMLWAPAFIDIISYFLGVTCEGVHLIVKCLSHRLVRFPACYCPESNIEILIEALIGRIQQ